MQPEKTKKTDLVTPKKAIAKKAAAKKTPKTAKEAPKDSSASAAGKAAQSTVLNDTSKKAGSKKSPSAEKKVTPKKSKTTSLKKDQVALTFLVGYRTQFGQRIKLCGDHPALGNGQDDQAVELQFEDPYYWSLQINLKKSALPAAGISYYYLVENLDGSVDKSAPYHLNIPVTATSIIIQDAWNSPSFIENAFSTDVFEVLQKQGTKAAAGQSNTSKAKKTKPATHHFRVKAPVLKDQEVICLIGNHQSLGAWDAQKVILLTPDGNHGDWIASVQLDELQQPLEYKYGFYDTAQKIFLDFEQGGNRILTSRAQGGEDQIVLITDGFVRTN